MTCWFVFVRCSLLSWWRGTYLGDRYPGARWSLLLLFSGRREGKAAARHRQFPSLPTSLHSGDNQSAVTWETVSSVYSTVEPLSKDTSLIRTPWNEDTSLIRTPFLPQVLNILSEGWKWVADTPFPWRRNKQSVHGVSKICLFWDVR